MLSIIRLSPVMLVTLNTVFNAERNYTECHKLNAITLSVIKLSVAMLNAMAPARGRK
jgi:hypothetical protein